MNITARVPMTKQQVFDKVVTHLLAQGEASTAGRGCAYRGRNGLMCAVGCLIPDEMYNSEMEGILAGFVIAGSPELQQLFAAEVLDSDFLGQLQSCHDGAPVTEWPAELRLIAGEHDLILPKELL